MLFPATRLTRLFALLLFSGCVTVAVAQERILSFGSDIHIFEDGAMNVTETLRVRAEGVAIQRGIYRDFPTRYEDRLGNRVVVDFDVLDVLRDGQPEPWFTESRSNGVRVYVGSQDVFLAPGEYSYTIRYRTNRQLGYFQDHDELYWNVTGNDWQFVIASVSARVMLPTEVAATQITMEGYTGAEGEAGQAYTVSVFDGGASIETSRPLRPQEGLTLVMTWPKGVVVEPPELQQLGFLLTDNLGLLLALVAVALILAYLLAMWHRYGRDPEAGVIFPHYQPPSGYSPASARYITRMGYDNRTLTAAIINLAVNGHVKIDRKGDEYSLEKAESDKVLAAGEKQLLNRLFVEGRLVELKNSNHRLISQARSAHSKALRRDYLGLYFKKNTALILPGILLLVLMLAAVGVFASFSPAVVVLAVLAAGMIVLFSWLLKAPTPRGRLLLDKLEGFRLYLEVAEKDDLALRHPVEQSPELTPQLFERYLPFAIALGVEQPWAERFSAVFAGLAASGNQSYQPAWYHGHFNVHDPVAFSGQLSRSFTSAISSAASPPGSSSGSGGGGFSGGGGGGGGGGGW